MRIGSPRPSPELSVRTRAARPRRSAWSPAPDFDLLLRGGDQPFADRLFARSFPGAPHRFTFFPRRLCGGLFIESALLHFAKHAFALHLLLQHAKSLVDIVVADEDLQRRFLLLACGRLRSAERK